MSIDATVFMTLLWKDKRIYRTTLQDTDDTAYDEIEFLKAIKTFYIDNDWGDDEGEDFTITDFGKYTMNMLSHYADIMQFIRNNYEDHHGSIHVFVNFELPCDNYFTTFIYYKNIFNNKHDEIEYINKHIYGTSYISYLLESIKNIGKTKDFFFFITHVTLPYVPSPNLLNYAQCCPPPCPEGPQLIGMGRGR